METVQIRKLVPHTALVPKFYADPPTRQLIGALSQQPDVMGFSYRQETEASDDGRVPGPVEGLPHELAASLYPQKVLGIPQQVCHEPARLGAALHRHAGIRFDEHHLAQSRRYRCESRRCAPNTSAANHHLVLSHIRRSSLTPFGAPGLCPYAGTGLPHPFSYPSKIPARMIEWCSEDLNHGDRQWAETDLPAYLPELRVHLPSSLPDVGTWSLAHHSGPNPDR